VTRYFLLLIVAIAGFDFQSAASNIPAPAATPTEQSTQSDVELAEATKLMESAPKLFQAGQDKEAIQQTKRALEIRERLLPADSALIDNSLNYLGQMYVQTNNYSEAKTVLQRVLERREQKLGVDHESLTATIDTLAVMHFRLRDFKTSEKLYLRSLKIKELKFGLESPKAARGHYNLGEYYRIRGNYDQALKSYKQALLIIGKLDLIKTDDFEKITTGMRCVAYQTRQLDKLKDIEKILDPFASDSDPATGKIDEILNGKALRLPAPVFPDLARITGTSGIVVVRILIDEEGKVINASDMCQGSPYLTSAAIHAARKAMFSPTKVNGVPIQVSGVVVYNFVHR
jgi:TonB family protein